MRVHCDVANDLHALDAIYCFSLLSLDSRVRYELLTRRYIDENCWVIFWVDTFFHGENGLVLQLTLTGLETWVSLADHVDSALAANHLAVWVTFLS